MGRKLRILCLDHEGGYGGSSRSLYHLIRAMDRRDLELEVWCRREGPIQPLYRAIGVPVHVVPALASATTLHRISRTLASFARVEWRLFTHIALRRALLEAAARFDVIHFNHPNQFLLARWLRARHHVVTTMHVRTVLEELYEGTPEGPIARVVNRYASRSIARWQIREMSRSINGFAFITENEQEAFYRLGGSGEGTIVSNVAERPTDSAAPDPRIPLDARFKVACLENYHWSRGTDRLVEIAGSLKDLDRDDILFVVAGDMTIPRSQRVRLGEANRKVRQFGEWVRARGLEPYFVFLGHVSTPGVVLAGTDALVSLPRRAGSWGRNVIEAMAFGRPVVATGAWDGFVRHEITGLLHPTYDASAIAGSLCRLADNPSFLQRLGKQAQIHIAGVCDGPINAARLRALWESAARVLRRCDGRARAAELLDVWTRATRPRATRH